MPVPSCFLAAVFLSVQAPPRGGILLRSGEEPRRFSAFGPGPRRETIAAIRAHPGMAAAVGTLTALCAAAALGTSLVAASAGEAAPVE